VHGCLSREPDRDVWRVLQECYDLVALLLMIRMNYHHQLIMNKRRIPCLDDYLDRVNLLLWPRFKVCAPFLSPDTRVVCQFLPDPPLQL